MTVSLDKTPLWVRPVEWANLDEAERAAAAYRGYSDIGHVVREITGRGQRAAWYAWGRFDQGHPLFDVVDAHGYVPTSTDLVLAFKILCENAQRDYLAGHHGSLASMQDHWAQFVLSNGETVYPR
jgi:hypothetical protein